jgi:hypothetical protein
MRVSLQKQPALDDETPSSFPVEPSRLLAKTSINRAQDFDAGNAGDVRIDRWVKQNLFLNLRFAFYFLLLLKSATEINLSGASSPSLTSVVENPSESAMTSK